MSSAPECAQHTVLYVLMRCTLKPAAAKLSCKSVDAFTLAGYSTLSLPPCTWGSSAPITLPRAWAGRQGEQHVGKCDRSGCRRILCSCYQSATARLPHARVCAGKGVRVLAKAAWLELPRQRQLLLQHSPRLTEADGATHIRHPPFGIYAACAQQ